jgi:hypothetical protein
MASKALIERLSRLIRPSFTSFKVNIKSGSALVKLQLFLFLTKAESGVLEQILEPYQLSNNQKNLLKFKLYVDFLRESTGLPRLQWSDLRLRDQIKQGKPACTEFKLSQGTARPQTIHQMRGTETTTAFIGAASMPPSLNGTFTSDCADQANRAIFQLVRNEFRPAVYTPTVKMIMEKAVNKFIKSTKILNSEEDHSQKMKAYFSRRLSS